jgi:ubiquinone biosynthesis protein
MRAGKRFRQLQRYRTIAAALARNGLGYVVQESGLAEHLPFVRNEARSGVQGKSLGERIRLLLEELGPTFVKLGQLASTRPDLIPHDILAELEQLQDRVPAFSYTEAAAILEEELGAPLDLLFRRFSETPIAAASIGQVHHAELPDGTAVAVKVQRPGIRDVIETDLDILTDWARLAENRLDWARRYRLRDIVDELGRALRAELDYRTEARNAEIIARHGKPQLRVHVPKVYWEYSTSRVLTMSYMDGIKLSDMAGLDEAGIDRKRLAERFTAMILEQVLVNGAFHADPHPGNVLVRPDGDLVLLDFGMVGQLTPQMRNHFAAFVIALRNQSTKGVIRAVSNMGVIPEDVDSERLYADVDALRDKYYKVPLEQISIGEAVRDLFSLALKHRIRIPAQLTLLGKTLLTAEGVVAALDPAFSMFDAAEPFGRKLFLNKLDPLRMVKSWLEDVPDYLDLLRGVPLSLKQLAGLIRKGQVRVEVTVPELKDLMRKLDRIGSRLALGIALLSLSIVMVGLIIGFALRGSQTLLWRFPVIEIGFIVTITLFLWLIFAILRSGRF